MFQKIKIRNTLVIYFCITNYHSLGPIKNTNLSFHSFCGSEVWYILLSWVLCSGSQKVSVKVSAMDIVSSGVKFLFPARWWLVNFLAAVRNLLLQGQQRAYLSSGDINLFLLRTAFLKYNSHPMHFTHLRFIIQCVFKYFHRAVQPSLQSEFRTFLSSPKKLCPIEVILHSSLQPYATTRSCSGHVNGITQYVFFVTGFLT